MPFLVSVSGEDAELEIIDGSQRIRTLVEYCNNDLKLTQRSSQPIFYSCKFNNVLPFSIINIKKFI